MNFFFTKFFLFFSSALDFFFLSWIEESSYQKNIKIKRLKNRLKIRYENENISRKKLANGFVISLKKRQTEKHTTYFPRPVEELST